MDYRPSWACDRYGDYEHDWLDCYECQQNYERYLDQVNDVYRKQYQTIFGNGKGNCFSTCIACVINAPTELVPNFCGDSNPNWRESANKWLSRLGYFYLDVMLRGDLRDELVIDWGFHVISGSGPRGSRHSVVGFRGKFWHDPHPDNTMLVGDPDDWEYGLIVPKVVNAVIKA